MNKSYFGLSRGSAVSGAGSYSQRSPKISCGIALDPVALVTGLVDVMSVTLGGLGEVVRRLVRAGLFLVDLAQQVVQQRARAKAVATGIQPGVAEGFLYGNEIVKGLLGSWNCTRRLHFDCASRRRGAVAKRLDPARGVGSGKSRLWQSRLG